MTELDIELKEKIQTLIDESLDVYSDDSIDECIELLEKAWSLVPDPKENWEEGYLVTHEIFETYFIACEFELAHKWAEIYLKCDEKHRNFGDAEFYLGKMAYEEEELDKARKYFEIADKKSGGRVWPGEDEPKYYKFFKSK